MKSARGKELVKNVPVAEAIPKPFACIIDAMALVNKITCDKCTFQQIVDDLLKRVLEEAEGSIRVDVIFDVYRDISIKDAERHIRAA